MDCSTYHGNMTKHECEDLLSKKGKDGSFLIRDSETIQGALCLCVYKKKVVYTYRVLQSREGYYALQTSAGVQEKFFKTLEELVKHYRRKNRGLATRLRYSVKCESRGDGVPEVKDVQDDQRVQDEDDAPDYENVTDHSEYVIVLPQIN